MMKKVSIAFPVHYYNSARYLPLIDSLDKQFCCAYGIGFPRGKVMNEEYVSKMSLTKLPNRLSLITKALSHIFRYPDYYSYFTRVWLCDFLFSRKIKYDESSIVLTSPLFIKTIKAAKSLNKIIIVEAGNSEPKRENKRIVSEYNKFEILNRYIYADPLFTKTCEKSLGLADFIITISKVSKLTYINAGYDMAKFKLIPLTGTDFQLQKINANRGKEKAFISTAFHSFIKGTHRLLLAWKNAGIKNIPLIIVGRLCDDIQEFIEKYGPFDNVIYLGHQSNLKELYSKYDAVGILLSLSEGAVRVTPEMMSFGFPMIVSSDATCDLIEDGVNGYIVDVENTDSISEKLCCFAENWDHVNRLRKHVLSAVNARTMSDYSLDLAEFIKTI